MWDLLGPGFKPVSPALAGGFLTTAPPRKSLECLLRGPKYVLSWPLPLTYDAVIIFLLGNYNNFPSSLCYFITAYISLLPELLFLNTNLIWSLLTFSRSWALSHYLSAEWNSFSLSWETRLIIWLQVIFLRKPHLGLLSFLPLSTHFVFQPC